MFSEPLVLGTDFDLEDALECSNAEAIAREDEEADDTEGAPLEDPPSSPLPTLTPSPEAIATLLPLSETAEDMAGVLSDTPSSPLPRLTPSPEPTPTPSYANAGSQAHSLTNAVLPSGGGKSDSKKRYNADLRPRKRQQKREQMDALDYKPSQHITDAHGDPPAVHSSASARKFTRADGAWIGKRMAKVVGGKSSVVEDLVSSGFQYIESNDARCVVILLASSSN